MQWLWFQPDNRGTDGELHALSFLAVFRQVVFRQLLLTGAGLFTPFLYIIRQFPNRHGDCQNRPAELMMGSLSNKNCQMSASTARLPCVLAVIDIVFEPDAMALYWARELRR